MRRMPTDAEWVASRIEDLPAQWGIDLVTRWERRKDRDYRGANIELREATKPFLAEPLPLDASDPVICEAAKHHAERCFSRAQLFKTIPSLRAAMERVCLGQGIEPPDADRADQAAIARMTCHLWWRRKLRRRHGRTQEAAAIRLGRVSRKGNLYVSDEGLRARQQQNLRNAVTLEATVVRNELEQEFTLAELQSKSTSNKKLKRIELMTRMSGFERYADKHGHTGLFLTMTCPSRFHRFRTVKGGKVVIDNPNHQPDATPAEGQRYLGRVWSRIRAELARNSLGIYGFRIAEPQHDGTPHWHLLLFCQPEHADLIEAVTDDQEAQGAAWDMYCDAQGGVFCGRDGLIKLMKEQPEALGQYGEQQAPRPVGVQVVQTEEATPPYRNGMSTGYRSDLAAEITAQACMGNGYSEGGAQKVWEVRSARYKWEVVSVRQRDIATRVETERAQPSTPWTRVDNCTEPMDPDSGRIRPVSSNHR